MDGLLLVRLRNHWRKKAQELEDAASRLGNSVERLDLIAQAKALRFCADDLKKLVDRTTVVDGQSEDDMSCRLPATGSAL